MFFFFLLCILTFYAHAQIAEEELQKGFQPVTLMFSAQTSSIRTQQIIETKLEKKRKNLLGAPVGKRVVMFIDDVNMPALDEYPI